MVCILVVCPAQLASSDWLSPFIPPGAVLCPCFFVSLFLCYRPGDSRDPGRSTTDRATDVIQLTCAPPGVLLAQFVSRCLPIPLIPGRVVVLLWKVPFVVPGMQVVREGRTHHLKHPDDRVRRTVERAPFRTTGYFCDCWPAHPRLPCRANVVFWRRPS